MNKDIKYVVVILVCLFCTKVFAGGFIEFGDDGNIVNGSLRAHESKGRAFSIRDDCIRANAEQRALVGSHKKLVAGLVVPWTAQEISDRTAELQAETDVAEALRIERLDNGINNVVIEDAVYPKVDTAIDAIDSYAKLKAFLKKQTRYLLND